MRWIHFSKKESETSKLIQFWIMLALSFVSFSVLFITKNEEANFLDQPDIFCARIALTIALSCSMVRLAQLVEKLWNGEVEE